MQLYKDFAAFFVLPIAIAVVVIFFFSLPIDNFESFVRKYQSTIISLGTLALISFLALFTAHLSNKAADRRDELAIEASDRRETLIAQATDRREALNQRVQAELQIAQFRQAWINEMRGDLAELIRLIFHSPERDDIARGYYLHTKIIMRLNLEEPLAERLSNDLGEMIKADLSDEELGKARAKATVSGHAYLKNEWKRLKSDIREAQLLSVQSE